MAYLGQQPVVGRYILVDDISSGFDGSDTTFNLQASSSAVIPGLAQNLLLSLGGIIQKPGTDYTVSGSVLTFTTAPGAGTTFFATILGDAYAVGTPSDGTVQPASIANTGNFAFPDEIRWLEDSGNGSNYVGFKAAASISSNKIWTLPSADGSAGQHLATDGNGVLSWATDQAGVALTGSTNNTICTVTGANAITGEAKLTYDGSHLSISTDAHGEGIKLTSSADTYNGITFDANRSGADTYMGALEAKWNGSLVSFISFETGTDTTNKDDGLIAFSTRASGSSIAERLRITSDGKIGIGIAAPASILHVAGASSPIILNKPTDASPAYFVGDSNRTGAGQHLAEFKGRWNGNDVARIVFLAGSDTSNKDDGVIRFDTTTSGGSSTERLRIDSSGKVGIGTTSPGTLLDCEIAASDKLEYGGNPRLFLQCATGNNGLRIYADTSPLEVRADNTSRYFFVNGSPTFDTTWAGKTCTSGSTFDSSPKIFLNGTRWNGSASVTSFQTSIQAVALSATNNDGYLGLGASATPDDVRIKTDGKVGINQTPAVSYLEITHAGTSTPLNQIELNTSNVTDGGGSGIFLKNSGATGSAHTNRYGSRIHTIRESNGASVFVISNEKTGGTTGLIEAVRIDADQNVKVSNGNLVIGTSGKGIDFSAASHAGGMTSELLDDYEEGTWTPTISCSSGSGTGGTSNGYYTKIGNLVIAHGTLQWTGISGTTTTYVQLNGFPFTTKNATGYRSGYTQNGQVIGIYWNGEEYTIGIGCDANQSMFYITAQNLSATSGTNYTHTPTVNSSGTLYGISAVYLTD